jgi:tetratricopeptide (TPR) repeat protein
MFDVGSEQDELREAEGLFRRTLAAGPTYHEARIRLGRVLGRQGRHEEAARELRAAVAAVDVNPLLLYYASMFLGVEAEALGRSAEAKGAYERAAKLYPDAQSPGLALSALALRRGDREAALRLIEPVLNREKTDEGRDPWWTYERSQTRVTGALLNRLYGLILAGDPR